MTWSQGPAAPEGQPVCYHTDNSPVSTACDNPRDDVHDVPTDGPTGEETTPVTNGLSNVCSAPSPDCTGRRALDYQRSKTGPIEASLAAPASAAADIYPPSAKDSLSTRTHCILTTALGTVLHIQAAPRCGLHCVELLIDVSRDEPAWRRAAKRGGRRSSASAGARPVGAEALFVAAARSWENATLFVGMLNLTDQG